MFPAGFHAASLFPTATPKCQSETKLKSGVDRSVAPSAAIFVLWPHEAFDRVSGQKEFKQYSSLTAPALAAGMVRSLMYQQEFATLPPAFQMQVQHMSTLFHSLVASDNLQAVLEFNKSVLFMLERGQLRWSPEFAPLLQSMQIQYLANLRPSLAPYSSSGKKAEKPDNANKDTERDKRFAEVRNTFCAAFQRGECAESGDHGGKFHLCKFCFGMRSQRQPHKPSNCPSKPPQ